MSSDIYRSLKSEVDKGKKAVVVTLMNDGDSGDSLHNKIILTQEQLSTPILYIIWMIQLLIRHNLL